MHGKGQRGKSCHIIYNNGVRQERIDKCVAVTITQTAPCIDSRQILEKVTISSQYILDREWMANQEAMEDRKVSKQHKGQPAEHRKVSTGQPRP